MMPGPALATAAVAGALLVAAPAKARVGDVVQRAAQWVQRFERDFITVIADETYDQSVSHTGRPGVQQRQIRSELLFMRVETDASWFAVRNVLSYADEGKPAVNVLNSRDRLTDAIDDNRSGGRSALRRLADEGARFNIGGVARNFNTPTLALQFLDDAHRARFKFQLQELEPVGADQAWRMSYEERRHPTLIQANFRDTELSGRIWTRVSDGAVLRTKMDLEAGSRAGYSGLSASITIDYMQDAKLGTMVPARMEERYVEGLGETVLGAAVYSNYRVFETSARVVAPQ
jgi:hypothetical protein